MGSLNERVDELGDGLIRLACQSTDERAAFGGEVEGDPDRVVFAFWATFLGWHAVQNIRHDYAIKKNLRAGVFWRIKYGMREKIREEPVRMTLYMEKSTRERLRVMAKQQGLSISQFIEVLAKKASKNSRGEKKPKA